MEDAPAPGRRLSAESVMERIFNADWDTTSYFVLTCGCSLLYGKRNEYLQVYSGCKVHPKTLPPRHRRDLS